MYLPYEPDKSFEDSPLFGWANNACRGFFFAKIGATGLCGPESKCKLIIYLSNMKGKPCKSFRSY